MTRCTSRTSTFVFLVLTASLSIPAFAQLPAQVFPTADAWQTLTPAEVGLDAAKLAEAQAYAESKTGSGIIIRRGYKVHEWGSQTFRYPVASVTKGIGALLLGLAVDDGAVTLADRAQSHFPDLGIPPDENGTGDAGQWRTEVTIEQLATHSSGFDNLKPMPKLRFQPGTKWVYSDGGANWLADTLTFRIQQDLREVLASRILDNIGITVRRGGSSGDLFWRDRSANSTFGTIPRREFNAGISVNVDSMARLGLLVETGGDWNGNRLLSQAYITKMMETSPIINGLPIVKSNNLDDTADFPNVTAHHGLFWFNNADGTMSDVPRDTAWTWGAGDHLIVVIPSLDLVIARTSGAAVDGSPSLPWDRLPSGCTAGVWCGRYDVLVPFLTPIVQNVTGEPQPPPPPPPGAPTVSLTSNVTTVTAGGTATLTWSSTLADACTASNGWTGAKAAAGTETVTVTQNTTYTLACTGTGGTTESSVAVTVSSGNPTPPPGNGGGGGGGGGALQLWMLGALLAIGGARRVLRSTRRRNSSSVS